jgi:hypothetical protein
MHERNPHQIPSRLVEGEGELYLARTRRDVNVSASGGGVAAGGIHGNAAPPESAAREAGRPAEAALAGAPREGAEAAEPQNIASLHPAAPSQPAVYDDLVRKAFVDLVKPGRLLFNPPDRMELGQTVRVEVRLTRTLELDAELLEHLGGPGEPQLEEIPTAPLMAVTLKGDGFRITPYSDEEQGVTQGGITTWEFDIRALKRGSQRLVMCVSLRVPVPGPWSTRVFLCAKPSSTSR